MAWGEDSVQGSEELAGDLGRVWICEHNEKDIESGGGGSDAHHEHDGGAG